MGTKQLVLPAVGSVFQMQVGKLEPFQLRVVSVAPDKVWLGVGDVKIMGLVSKYFWREMSKLNAKAV